MSDWREERRRELVEKQRHISQKLAQVREFRRVTLKWERQLRQLRDWFAGLEASADGVSNWFSVGSLIRMNSITGSLEQMIAEFEQVGDPKTTGAGTTMTSSASAASSASVTSPSDGPNPGQIADWLTSRAGPLATSTPWELIPSFAPEAAESVAQGDYGAAAAAAIFSPFTSMTAIGFAQETLDLSVELIKTHEAEFDDLENGWKNAKNGLTSVVDALGAVDQRALEALETELGQVLDEYERTYDGGLGADERSARQLRAQAERPGGHVSDQEVGAWDALLNEQIYGIDSMLAEGNRSSGGSSESLPGLDD